MFDLNLTSFRVSLACHWIDQRDKETALGELPDWDMGAVLKVNRHFRERLAARLHRVEE